MNRTKRDRCLLYNEDPDIECDEIEREKYQCSKCPESLKIEDKIEGIGLNPIEGYSTMLFEGCPVGAYFIYSRLISWASYKVHEKAKLIDFDEMNAVQVAIIEAYENDIAVYQMLKNKSK